MQRQVIHNIKQIIQLALFLLLWLHLVACMNIFMGTKQDGFIPLTATGATVQDSFDLYIDQLYFMTTTMTTIGFGDFSAAKYPDYDSSDNMTLIFFILFASIFTFTLIQDLLFSLHFDVKLNEYIKKYESEAFDFLSAVDLVMKRQWDSHHEHHGDGKYRMTIPENLWADFLEYTEINARHSCFDSFANHTFYQELPPRLQDKLV